MKLNRLLEITTILLNKKTVTALELARRFDVSVRTIYRDIDVLSSSGVPVYSTRGSRGGISIMEDYAVSRVMLSDNEKNSILFALQTLKSTKYPQIDLVLDKLGSIFKNSSTEWITIDFTPWGSDPNYQNKFLDIKRSILNGNIIEFDYINAKVQNTRRRVQPLRLIYKEKAWYIWGFCQLRDDFRLFKISRLKNVYVLPETFDRKALLNSVPAQETDNCTPQLTCVEMIATEKTLFRLYDDFNDEAIKRNHDGTCTITFNTIEDEWLYSYILSFGCEARVVSPEHVCSEVRRRMQAALDGYMDEDAAIATAQTAI